MRKKTLQFQGQFPRPQKDFLFTAAGCLRRAAKTSRSPVKLASLLASTFLLSQYVFAPSSHADFVIHHWEDEYEPFRLGSLDANFNYYTTTQNYDPTGNRYTPNNFTKYERDEADVFGSFGVVEDFSIFARLALARINLSATSYGGTAYGLVDQSIGGTWRIFRSVPTHKPVGRYVPITVDLQVQGDLPTYGNSTADSNKTPYLGDATFDMSFGGFVSIPLGQNAVGDYLFTAGAGFTYRSNDYSSALPWQLGVKYERTTNGFIFGVDVFGDESIRNDRRNITIASATDLNNLSPGSGGSFITSAVNPSLITVRGLIGYQMKSGSSLHLEVDQSVWGQDAPYGTNVVVGFETHFGQSSESHLPSQQVHDYDHANQGFVNYSMDALVLRSNDRLNLVKINKGSQDGVAIGQVFDVFNNKADNTPGEAIARCQVVSVKNEEAAMSVTEYFKEVWIDEGFTAKRLIQTQ